MPRVSGSNALPLPVGALFAPAEDQPALGLAVSGGPDSLALMLLAHGWAASRVNPPRLIVYTVDHGLRAAAEEEARFVVRTAESLGLSARLLRWEGDKPASGLQSAARQARYRLMGKAMADDGATMLLTGHHRNDQAETVLMRLAHGSGLAGLAGMAALSSVEGVPVFRPLLDVAPERLRAVVAEAGLDPVHDPSNDNDAFERVRWRNLIPELDVLGLGPDRIVQMARRAAEADAVLERLAEEACDRLVTTSRLGAARIDSDALAGLERAVAVRLLARLMDAVGGGRKPHALGMIEDLHDDLSAGRFADRTLAGCLVRLSGPCLWVVREPGRMGQAEHMLAPGQSIVWDNRFAIGNGSDKSDLSVHMAAAWNRKGAESLLGEHIEGPIEALRTSPVVLDGAGRVLALGCRVLDQSVSVNWVGWRKGRIHPVPRSYKTDGVRQA